MINFFRLFFRLYSYLLHRCPKKLPGDLLFFNLHSHFFLLHIYTGNTNGNIDGNIDGNAHSIFKICIATLQIRSAPF